MQTKFIFCQNKMKYDELKELFIIMAAQVQCVYVSGCLTDHSVIS